MRTPALEEQVVCDVRSRKCTKWAMSMKVGRNVGTTSEVCWSFDSCPECWELVKARIESMIHKPPRKPRKPRKKKEKEVEVTA